MCHDALLRKLNVADLDRRVVLPVAALNVVLTARLVLEDLELRPAILGDDLAGDLGLRDDVRGDEFLFVIAHGNDLVEGDVAADFAFQALDANGAAGLDDV